MEVDSKLYLSGIEIGLHLNRRKGNHGPSKLYLSGIEIGFLLIITAIWNTSKLYLSGIEINTSSKQNGKSKVLQIVP